MGQLNKRNKNIKFDKDKLYFDGELSNIKPIGNTGFSKTFIKILYDKGNRNSSYFDKDMVINKMIPTLYNVPITGNYKKNIDNFGGHDSKLELTSDGDINYIDLTVPYGVVPESSVVEWQNIVSSDEKVLRDYLTCDGILWTGRYQEQLDKLLEDGMNISMEVEIIDGKEEQDGLYHVYDAQFSSLTILGKSDNTSDNVEPCFHDSSIEAYSLDSFKQNFSLMLKEIKNSLNSESESKTSDFDLNNKIIQDKEKEDKNMSKEEISKNEDEFKAKDTVKPVPEDTKTEKGDTAKDREKITKEKADGKVKADKEAKCSLEDSKKYELEIAELKETIANQNAKIESLNSKFESIKTESEPVVENADLKDLNEKFSALEKTVLAKDTELLELKEFKATTLKTEIQAKADTLFAKYVEYINEDEKKDLNSKLFELKFEDFEDKVKAIALPKVEAKLYALNQKSNLEDPNKINISLMGLPVVDNIKNSKASKTSIELLEEYVQN